MNIKAISRNVGFALLVSALFMFLSIIVSMLDGNDSALAALMISFTITFVVGAFPLIFVRKSPAISLKDGYMIIFLSWTLSFIFGMLPYLLWGGPFTVVNALFESVSGFTTTGGTILENVEALPRSLLFWRSSTHFIGGLGVVVFLLLIIPSSNPVRLRLANMEISSLSQEGYQSRANKTVYIFTYVYLAITVVAYLLYRIGGMSAFDALNHAFSVAATGGFSTHTESFAAFHSTYINIVTIILMVVGSLHFGLLYLSVVMRSLRPLNNAVLKFYLIAMLTCSLAGAMILRIDNACPNLADALMQSTFHVVSFASTTGFAIGDNAMWPMPMNVILALLGIMCGMAGSTTGGVKSDRFFLLMRAIVRQVRRTLHPSSVRELKVGSHTLHDDEVYPQILYIGLYCITLFLAMIVLQLVGVSDDNAFFAAVSTLGNVGPAVGEMGTLGNYAALTVGGKICCCFYMFLGRVEIYPVLTIFMMIFDRRK